jgi:ABC-type spermidine/putrescine transport system permease subunit II
VSATPPTRPSAGAVLARARPPALSSDRLAGVGGAVAVGATALLLLAPAALVALLSFSDEAFFEFPPKSFGLRQYRTLLEAPRWGSALWLSLRIALVVALLSALVVVPTLFALYRSRLPWRGALQAGGLIGIVLPISAYAVALYGVFATLGLLGSFWGLALSYVALGVPMMLLVSSAAMARIPVELELAAMAAGASRARAWSQITLRLLGPAILAGAVLTFVTSIDEAVLVNFLGGPGLETLPKAILDSVRYGLEPVIAAIATVLMVGTSLAMALAARLARRDAR